MLIIGIIILAAGNSSRLGRPKQLVEYNGALLLERAISVATSVGVHVSVVTGAYEEQIVQTLMGTHIVQQSKPSINFVRNANWQGGMGSSIAAGVTSLPSSVNASFILSCDQPHVDQALLYQMIARMDHKKCDIVACRYDGTFGIPALFRRSLFEELCQLDPAKGAKGLISAHLYSTELVDFENAAIDIDTIDDLNNLINAK